MFLKAAFFSFFVLGQSVSGDGSGRVFFGFGIQVEKPRSQVKGYKWRAFHLRTLKTVQLAMRSRSFQAFRLGLKGMGLFKHIMRSGPRGNFLSSSRYMQMHAPCVRKRLQTLGLDLDWMLFKGADIVKHVKLLHTLRCLDSGQGRLHPHEVGNRVMFRICCRLCRSSSVSL